MKNHKDEKRRALNIIWNAADDYTINSQVKLCHEDASADVYINYIVGAVHKYYDYPILQSFFDYLKVDSEHEFYEKLMWIGLENGAYLKGKNERPVLESLRRDYSRNVVEEIAAEKNILHEIRIAHFCRVLGIETKTEGRLLDILNLLEFDEEMDAEHIVLRMNDIIRTYFRFNPGTYETNQQKEIISIKSKNIKDAVLKNDEVKETQKEKQKDSDNSFMKDLVIESAETARDINILDHDDSHKKILIENKFSNKIIETDRHYIQKYYGASILSEHRTRLLEQVLCAGNHKKSHLHFTRGEFDFKLGSDADAVYFKKAALEQRERNINYYNEFNARNHESISKLTNKIRNTLIVNFESSSSRSKTGKLCANMIWRNAYLKDSKVFIKDLRNALGNITVDILLDSSASQFERQEIIASQGFVIAESFTRCQIPVRVYSFSSLRNFTIINLHRDYSETDKNDWIFKYNASGCNRDGLAIRTALHMMENYESEHKILIVLSDCKPNDIQCIPETGMVPAHSEYSGAAGVNDSAFEVKKGINKGVSILCVFTGEDEDVDSAKKIYGHNFARISSPERFADIVGVLMQNQLKNL
ncbi:MAG: hypothetical protein SA378_00160 [Sedimentibacter sp.]|uniref:hypothetical protein n=1 Tax=Sedimentibacter sp. TaxID=1960295 RepID=UPI002981AA5E|nr:hypothetical protein [Sedimentibacter sp.]MDW5298543.1 hypothetical protein [Sedimentibacter sp.]